MRQRLASSAILALLLGCTGDGKQQAAGVAILNISQAPQISLGLEIALTVQQAGDRVSEKSISLVVEDAGPRQVQLTYSNVQMERPAIFTVVVEGGGLELMRAVATRTIRFAGDAVRFDSTEIDRSFDEDSDEFDNLLEMYAGSDPYNGAVLPALGVTVTPEPGAYATPTSLTFVATVEHSVSGADVTEEATFVWTVADTDVGDGASMVYDFSSVGTYEVTLMVNHPSGHGEFFGIYTVGDCGTDSSICSGLTCCSGTCVDTLNDPLHCGVCNFPCDAGWTCVSGMCTGEICANSTDDDGDSFTDCADTDCDGIDGCPDSSTSTCSQTGDGDGDGINDCTEQWCEHSFACTSEICGNRVDDDDDGLVDCADVDDCAAGAVCLAPDASAACNSTGACVVVTCDFQREDCDSDGANGCEAYGSTGTCDPCGSDSTGTCTGSSTWCDGGTCMACLPSGSACAEHRACCNHWCTDGICE